MKRACLIWVLLTIGTVVGIFVDLSISSPRFGRIDGTVVNENAEPVAKAVVTLTPTGRTETTDNLGRFSFTDVLPGHYSLAAAYPGFEKAAGVEVAVVAGETADAEIRLHKLVEDRASQKPAAAGGTSTDYKAKEQHHEMVKSGSDLNKTITVRADKDILKKFETSNQTTITTQSLQPRSSAPLSCAPLPINPPYDMYFRDYGTNDFVSTQRDRFSTFATDVDDASFNVARTYLLGGNMPPADAIRVEEFINHFDYGYNPPDEGKFRVFSEVTSSPFDRRTVLLKLGIKAKEISEERRKPIRLTILVDVSGSMGYDNRIDLVKRSLEMLVDQLDERDMVGVVAYGSSAFNVLQPTRGNQKGEINDAIQRLWPNGSTYAEAGLKLAYQMANRQFLDGYSNIVILCSDGVANVGETSPDRIMKDIKRSATQGITLSTFGFGMGNYNDVLLEKLAQQGNGRYAYVNNADQAQKLFVEDLIGTIQVVARDTKIQVEFDPSTVSSYRLLGYENKAIADRKFRDDRQDGGEVGSGHEVTALYELMLNRNAEGRNLATVFVRWKNPRETQVTELRRDIPLEKRPGWFTSARPELRLAIVAAKFAELLKQTEYSGGIDVDELISMARSIDRQLPSEQSRDLVNLLERTRTLTGYYGRHQSHDGNYERDEDDD